MVLDSSGFEQADEDRSLTLTEFGQHLGEDECDSIQQAESPTASDMLSDFLCFDRAMDRIERLPVSMLSIPQRSPYTSACPERKKLF